MAVKKGFYDGCVLLNHDFDTLDLSGALTGAVGLRDYSAGSEWIRLMSVTGVSVGDKIVLARNGEYIGEVERIAGTLLYFKNKTRVRCFEGDFVEKKRKFEIVKIDLIGPNTYIETLTPIALKHPGTVESDFSTWNDTAMTSSFSSTGQSVGGGTMASLGGVPSGLSIEGRWKYVTIDDSSEGTSEAAICYLKAAPTIM